MPPRLPAAERRRQLLDHALATFAERGYHEASMNQVAEAAGVTKPVLYQHFGSKRALYLELVDDVGARLEEDVLKAVAQADSPRQQVEAGFGAFYRFVADDAAAFRLLFGGGTRRDDPDFAAIVERVETTFAESIAGLIAVEGLPGEHRRLLAHGIVGLAESTSRRLLDRDLELDPKVAAGQLAELVWAGLRGLHSPVDHDRGEGVGSHGGGAG